MTSQPPDDHGDLLRRVLRSEAERVVPSPEGLEIIRARLAERGGRGLFWWRAGASVASAMLVAGTVVMLVPAWRDTVITTVVGNTSRLDPGEPAVSSTERGREPSLSPETPSVISGPGTPTARPPQREEPRRADSTSRPSPTAPASCPAEPAEPPVEAADCPTADEPSTVTPSPEPSAGCAAGACPTEEAPAPGAPTLVPSPLTAPTG